MAAAIADSPMVPSGRSWSIAQTSQSSGTAVSTIVCAAVCGSSEEWKLVEESRKILHDDAMRITATCVRVPVFVGHAMCANVQFRDEMTGVRAAELLASAPGVVLVDGGAGAPTALEGAGIDSVLGGRLREDPSQPNTLDLWVTGDNLRKGAALNAVQMAELLIA